MLASLLALGLTLAPAPAPPALARAGAGSAGAEPAAASQDPDPDPQDAAEAAPGAVPAEDGAATGEPEGLWARLHDPQDGAFDITRFLAKGGFLPVPFLITEPALGFGGGLALVFVNSDPVPDPYAPHIEDRRRAPPDITAAFGAATDNGTRAAGLAHLGFWDDDTIRYQGLYVHGDVYLDTYVLDSPFEYNLDTDLLYQELAFRLGDSALFLGGVLNVSSTRTRFDQLPAEFPEELDLTNTGLGLKLAWDTRDNIFTPRSGVDGHLALTAFSEALGGDNDYEDLVLRARGFHPLGGGHVLGARLQCEHVEGGAPFYALPYVKLRGVPIQRYQGDSTLSFETELRFALAPRWFALGFAGTGAAWSNRREDSGAVFSGGIGGRYLISRPLNMTVGLDLARGPEDTFLLLGIGSGL